MRTWLGRGTFAAIVVFGAATAEAQITTVIETPKRTTVAAQQAAARREEVAQDSIARITMTGMKEWVDSAAASLAIRPDTGTVPASDTAAATRRSTQPTTQRSDSATATSGRSPVKATEFRDGARAPDTGTPVPTLAFLGALMVLAGALLRRRPTPAAARRSRR